MDGRKFFKETFKTFYLDIEQLNIEAVHLLASFANLEAKLSQLCSDVRQACLIMGKAAPALPMMAQLIT